MHGLLNRAQLRHLPEDMIPGTWILNSRHWCISAGHQEEAERGANSRVVCSANVRSAVPSRAQNLAPVRTVTAYYACSLSTRLFQTPAPLCVVASAPVGCGVAAKGFRPAPSGVAGAHPASVHARRARAQRPEDAEHLPHQGWYDEARRLRYRQGAHGPRDGLHGTYACRCEQRRSL